MGKLEIKPIEKTITKGKKEEIIKIKQFWVVVGESLHLFSDKTEAIKGLQEVLPQYPEGTLATITYEEKDGTGTFNVEGVSWKDIAMVWAGVESDSEEKESDEGSKA